MNLISNLLIFQSELYSEPSSTVCVSRSSRLHSSRPAGFGPHFQNPKGQTLNLIPIESINLNQLSSTKACNSSTINPLSNQHQSNPINPSEFPSTVINPSIRLWVALVERGSCTFIEKVRYAQSLGASAVIVGDWDHPTTTTTTTTTSSSSSSSSNLYQATTRINLPLIDIQKFGFDSGLVTMFASGDTSDVSIPSVFVARDSYLSLRKDWSDYSTTVDGQSVPSLQVIMSRDQVWTWPFFDLIIILLFLPSILTILTLILHRINHFRKQRADRAPREIVNSLPSVIWVKDMEKGIPLIDHQLDLDQLLQMSSSSSTAATATTSSTTTTRKLNSVGTGYQGFNAFIRRKFGSQDQSPSSNQPNRDSTSGKITEQSPLLHTRDSKNHKERVLTGQNYDADEDQEVRLDERKDGNNNKKRKIFFAQRECALCLSDFEVGDLIRILPCGHCFHQQEIQQNCMGIDSWLLKSKRLCPICRMSIVREPNEDKRRAVDDPNSNQDLNGTDVDSGNNLSIPRAADVNNEHRSKRLNESCKGGVSNMNNGLSRSREGGYGRDD
ncbi:hypothetical protein BY996DRAFT_8685707 [Phakopsora pachyrhizi]|nr:hypothetical protein BY996DRAFT_8685707 [Phakopsora pachyrhizi]